MEETLLQIDAAVNNTVDTILVGGRSVLAVKCRSHHFCLHKSVHSVSD